MKHRPTYNGPAVYHWTPLPETVAEMHPACHAVARYVRRAATPEEAAALAAYYETPDWHLAEMLDGERASLMGLPHPLACPELSTDPEFAAACAAHRSLSHRVEANGG